RNSRMQRARTSAGVESDPRVGHASETRAEGMNHRAILEVTMRFHARFLSLFAAAVIAIAPLDGLRAEEKLPSKRSADEAHTVVEKGRKVSVEYTLTLDGGEVADTNVGKAPLTYEQGGGTMLP